MIYLLDLNYTLVENSHQKRSPFSEQIKIEVYRKELIDKLEGQKVFLLTARPAKYQEETIQSIKNKTGWQPEKSFFNSYNLPPAQAKEKMLLEEIFPEFQPTENKFLGIESNPKTRAMYERYSIEAMTYKGFLTAK